MKPITPIQWQPGMFIEQGIYLGMPEDVYFGMPAISVSGLKEGRKSWASYRFGEREGTTAQALGKLWHTALLEPEALDTRFMPTSLKRFDERMQVYRDELALAGDRQLVKEPDWEEMQSMCASIFGQGGSLLESITHPDRLVEVSFFWWDYPAGVFCRGRADLLILTWGIAGDVKSCVHADDDFYYAVKDFKYHWQSSFYRRGLRKLGIEIKDFVFWAIEKSKPYLYQMWEMEQHMQDRADSLITQLLTEYRQCIDTNIWPGFPAESRIMSLSEWDLNKE